MAAPRLLTVGCYPRRVGPVIETPRVSRDLHGRLQAGHSRWYGGGESMSVVPVSVRFRLLVAGTLGAVLIGGVLGATGVSSGAAAPPRSALARSAPAQSALPSPPRPAHVASLAPAGAAGALTSNQVLRAAQTCASHAAAAGWANNGVYGGNLVTA